MFAFAWVVYDVYGGTMMGVELFVSPFLGAFTGALWGLLLGVIRVFPLRRGRLTIARLMLIVASVAAIFALTGVVGVFLLANAVLILPALCVAFLGVAKHHEHASRCARTAERENP